MRRTVAHKGFSWLSSTNDTLLSKVSLVQQSSSVRGKRHTTRVLYDVLNSVKDFMTEKVPYAHVTDLY